jgi:hypothetical protein
MIHAARPPALVAPTRAPAESLLGAPLISRWRLLDGDRAGGQCITEHWARALGLLPSIERWALLSTAGPADAPTRPCAGQARRMPPILLPPCVEFC